VSQVRGANPILFQKEPLGYIPEMVSGTYNAIKIYVFVLYKPFVKYTK
jgi:hypothetical protein